MSFISCVSVVFMLQVMIESSGFGFFEVVVDN